MVLTGSCSSNLPHPWQELTPHLCVRLDTEVLPYDVKVSRSPSQQREQRQACMVSNLLGRVS